MSQCNFLEFQFEQEDLTDAYVFPDGASERHCVQLDVPRDPDVPLASQNVSISKNRFRYKQDGSYRGISGDAQRLLESQGSPI